MIVSKNKLLTNQRDQRVSMPQVHAKIFGNTLNLPHLPVPKLSETLEKYLKSVRPFLNDIELSNTKMILEQFGSKNGIGNALQSLLVAKAETSENWLVDWWLDTCYLEIRDPLVVYSSPGLVLPFENFGNEDERLAYTAKLILAAVDYKLVIDNNKLPMDKMGKDALDMNQYKKIFGTCRIPGDKKDSLEYNSNSRHIVVVKNNNYFKLEVINNNGEVPSVNQLINQLQDILQQSKSKGPEVGVLTTENRDNWAKAYKNLVIDPANRISVNEIQKSLFLVALDNPMPEINHDNRTLASKEFIHGGGSKGNSANRWFDKTVQFIIGKDGTVGLTYEHSPSDGQPIAFMSDYLVDYIKNIASKNLPESKIQNGSKKLTFNITRVIEKDIQTAKDNLDKVVDNLDLVSFKFESFGKEFVKSQKLSPDSFIQIAIQSAFYRVHQVPGAHYEAAATRKYIHGRTETIRSCSIESVAFAKMMLDNKNSDEEKVEALREAINSHKTYSIEAVNGFGVDRHLLGLKLVALKNGIEMPALYKDPSFTRSSHMRILSSQVASKCDAFMCFGPCTPDGYACCYNPRANDINFSVTAFVADPETSALKFRQALEASLVDMYNLLTNKAEKVKN